MRFEEQIKLFRQQAAEHTKVADFWHTSYNAKQKSISLEVEAAGLAATKAKHHIEQAQQFNAAADVLENSS